MMDANGLRDWADLLREAGRLWIWATGHWVYRTPSTSIDNLELFAPIEPQGPKVLQGSASYEMATIPSALAAEARAAAEAHDAADRLDPHHGIPTCGELLRRLADVIDPEPQTRH